MLGKIYRKDPGGAQQLNKKTTGTNTTIWWAVQYDEERTTAYGPNCICWIGNVRIVSVGLAMFKCLFVQ